MSTIVPRVLSDIRSLLSWREDIIDGHVEFPSDSHFDNAVAAETIHHAGDMCLGALDSGSDLLHRAVTQLLLALPPGQCHSPLWKELRNPYESKSISLSGIVKGEFETGLFHVELGQLRSPIGPRIDKAIKRYNYENNADLTWKALGQKAWELLEREKVDTSKLSRIRNGQQVATIAEGGAFAYLLDVSPVWLCWGLGEMGRFPKDDAPSSELRREQPEQVTPEDLAIRRQG